MWAVEPGRGGQWSGTLVVQGIHLRRARPVDAALSSSSASSPSSPGGSAQPLAESIPVEVLELLISDSEPDDREARSLKSICIVIEIFSIFI